MTRFAFGSILVLGFALACWNGGLAQDLLPTPQGQLGGKVPLPTPAIPVTPPVPPLATIPIVLAPAPAAPTSVAPSLIATTTTSAIASPASAAQAADSVVTIQVGGVAAGSGSIVMDGTVVVTARDVVGEATNVAVIDARGERVGASVVGVDPESELVVLRADRALGSALALAVAPTDVGDPVVALGGPGANGSQPSTHGVVASTSAWFSNGPPAALLLETEVQAPASANGGALIDARGLLAGVLIDDRLAGSLVASPTSGAGSIRYAVPSALVRRVVDGLLQHGQVDYPFLGMAVVPATDDPAGPVRIGEVLPGSPAAQAGLQAGDVLTALNGIAFGQSAPASVELLSRAPGDRVQVRVRRDGFERTVDVTLGERPSP